MFDYRLCIYILCIKMLLKNTKKIIGIRRKHRAIWIGITGIVGICIVGLTYINYQSKDTDISSNNVGSKALPENYETQKETILITWKNIINSRNSWEEKYFFQKLVNYLNENEIKTPEITVMYNNGERTEYSYTDGLPKSNFWWLSMNFHISGNNFTPTGVRTPKDINTFYILFLE